MEEIIFNRCGSYLLRDGWTEKAISTIKTEKADIFKGDAAVYRLGVGSSMVRSLKYWLRSDRIIDPVTHKLSTFGELLYRYDRYLEDPFCWFLIHFFLVTNKADCPVAYEIFNSNKTVFSKTDIEAYLENRFPIKSQQVALRKDINIILRSYSDYDADLNPEENIYCPLSKLKLIEKTKDGSYRRLPPAISNLSYLLVYYVLLNCYHGQPFAIDDSFAVADSPAKIFNLSRQAYLYYLDRLKREGMITVNRTSGLNTVYFEKEMTLEELFKTHFST